MRARACVRAYGEADPEPTVAVVHHVVITRGRRHHAIAATLDLGLGAGGCLVWAPRPAALGLVLVRPVNGRRWEHT